VPARLGETISPERDGFSLKTGACRLGDRLLKQLGRVIPNLA